jgi:RNA polymerase sigma factor (sigma-70 family)
MGNRSQGLGTETPEGRGRGAPLRPPRIGQRSDTSWVGKALGESKDREIRMARRFPECRGLGREVLEDIYQETALALLRRPYVSEDHLRNALRTGIKHRALNHHRNERTRGRILQASAPGLQLIAEAEGGDGLPEIAALLSQDRLIVSEFLTELSPVEQRVFWLLAEGMQYRAIAPALGLDLNVARKASRTVEGKRERFQLLYDTGRLCGYRAATIQALQGGQETTEELAKRAFAHLESCAHCRAEHKTNATRLRQRFQGQAAALLPMPAILGHLGWLARLDLRFRLLLQRLLTDGSSSLGSGALRERALGALAGGGAATKGAIAVLVLGGTTIGAATTGVLDHHSPARHHAQSHLSSPVPGSSVRPSALTAPPVANPTPATAGRATRHSGQRAQRHHASRHTTTTGAKPVREPGGFSYLGVPESTPPTASSSSHSTPSTGGQFSP